ncbi:MAG TPA: hypothetical protein P5205_13575 [Candidatus Paceibacterota bacterium]|nr:hypothetical protein [Verrucomicrobiota bacterium]HSA11392.1 hypothetical protein [Candidatus Paceibacterota bacterium]
MGQRKPFLLRIDPALWAELEAWAQAELRSVNGQIEYLLRQALQKRKHSASRPASAPSAAPPEGGGSGPAG